MIHLLTLYYFFFVLLFMVCGPFYFLFFGGLFFPFRIFFLFPRDYLNVVLDWCACVVGVAVAIASLRYAAA